MTAPRYKLGRLPAERPVGLKAIAEYGSLPPAPQVFEAAVPASFSIGMLGNDQYGDCAFAGFVHANQAVAFLAGETPPVLTTDDVVSAYLEFAGGKDTGCSLAQVLQALYNDGILDVDVDAYAPIDGGLPEVLQAIAAFGCAYLGVNLPMNAQEQLESGLWTISSMDDEIEGGHCIDAIGYSIDEQLVEIETWGQRIHATFDWLESYLEESWAVLFSPAKDAGSLNGIDFATLLNDLDALPEAA